MNKREATIITNKIKRTTAFKSVRILNIFEGERFDTREILDSRIKSKHYEKGFTNGIKTGIGIANLGEKNKRRVELHFHK